MNEKDKWIDDALGSISGMQRAKPADDLFGRIEANLLAEKIEKIPTSRVGFAAVVAVILLTFNIYSVFNTSYETVEQNSQTSDQELISNYYLYE